MAEDNKEEKKNTKTKQPTKNTKSKNTATKTSSNTNNKSTTKKNTNTTNKKTTSTTKKSEEKSEKEIKVEGEKNKSKKSASTTAKKAASTAKNNSSKKTSNNTSSTSKKTSSTKQAKTKSTSKQVKKDNKQDDKKVKAILDEQLKNMDKIKYDSKEVSNKANPKTNKTSKPKFNPEKIAEKIQYIKKMPKEEKKKAYKDIFINLVVACIDIIYFTLLYLGYINMEGATFITSLKACSIILVSGSIVLFEVAYNKDSGKIAIFGIEVLINAIITLVLVYVIMLYKDIYSIMIVITSLSFTLYYIIKSIIVYFKKKSNYKKTISDVKDIIEDDELES